MEKSKGKSLWPLKALGAVIAASPFVFVLYQVLFNGFIEAVKTGWWFFWIIPFFGVSLAVFSLGVVIWNLAKLNEKE